MKAIGRRAVALGFALGLGAALLPTGRAWAACQLAQLAEFPLRLVNNQPLMDGEINGQKVNLMADTGAGRSTLLRAFAVKMKLHQLQLQGVTFYGIGGGTTPTYVNLEEIKIGGLARKDMKMLVMGENALSEGEPVALIGADFWGQADDEIDLAHKAIRLIKPEGCSGDQVLYWTEPFSATKLLTPQTDSVEYLVSVTLNGVPMRAELDTGSAISYVTRQGFTKLRMDWPSAPAAVQTSGLGQKSEATAFVKFKDFAFDEEKIIAPTIAVADLFGQDKEVPLGTRAAEDVMRFPDMILGADFFLAHRVLISNSQRKVYITYNGAPLFRPPPVH